MWTVVRTEPYESDEIEGMFSNKEAAEAAADYLAQRLKDREDMIRQILIDDEENEYTYIEDETKYVVRELFVYDNFETWKIGEDIL